MTAAGDDLVSTTRRHSVASGNGRTRILLIGRGLGPGGMERLLVAQAQYRDRDRFDYAVAYVTPEKNHLVGEIKELGVRVHPLGEGRVPWPVQVIAHIRRERYDVVHTHSPLVAAIVRVAARTMRGRPRIVYTEHNSWGAYSAPTRRANELTYRLDDAQIAVSRAAWESVPPRLRSRLTVIDHGIDVDAVRGQSRHRDRVRAELGIARDEVVVGIVANFRPEKNYEGLLRVAQRVTDTDPTVRFVSVGQGPLLEPIRQQAREMGLEDRFQLLGYRADATAYMGGFDVFALGSRWEGLPVAFMEARALGLPVVVTAVGGLVDHVNDGVDGLLVPAESDEALVAALTRVTADPVLRGSLAAASAASAAAFDARRAVAAIERFYSPV